VEFQDYYAVLGVPRAASQAEVKKAFRKLARQHHPDAKPGDTAAERKFKEINEANEVLSDPAKRRQYDQLGANWDQISQARAAGTSGASPFGGFGGGNVRYEFRTADAGEFSDFFRVFFGGEGGFADMADARSGAGRAGGNAGAIDLEEFLAGMGAGVQSGRGRATSRKARPAALPRHEAQAEITLDEAFHGTSRLVDVDGKRLEVTIPPGADTGTRIRLTGKAPGGGDIHIVVRQRPDATFTRKGADLERELPNG